MLLLLSLLQARRDWPGRLLAERLDVSARTVRRDVERLRDLGYRIQAAKGPDGGYRLDAGSELPPLLFDDEQAIALAVALQTANLDGTSLQEAAARALISVRQVMPSRLRHTIDALAVAQVPVGGALGERPIAAATILALSTAIRNSTGIRFDYGSPTSAPVIEESVGRPPVEVQPHGLVTQGGRWYLVAWHPRRDDWRIYRVDRLALRDYRGARFDRREVPGADVAAFVSARFKGSEVENVWPCRGVVRLATSARDIAPYVVGGTLEDLGPDRCRLSLGAWSWAGLAATIASFDADIEVESPPELRAAFGQLTARFRRAAGEASAG